MTMLEQRIQQHFFDSADLKYQSAEALARPVANMAQALVTGLTAGGRLLVAGSGACGALAQLAAALLVGGFERDRPGLPALPLGTNGVLQGALAVVTEPDQVLARQVQTLGAPGDLLLLLDTHGNDNSLIAALAAAQAKDMTVLVLSGGDGGALGAALSDTDVLVALNHDRRARIMELQLLVLHALCDAIDIQLLGEQEPA
ncbi:phosphoheptose isomerase [Burkholderiales bacterium JOSHI_001]|nr:phosphoheptose isomerase [Burkholderiales bacterium JOSHI_001]